jgi:hypothetical protein
VRLAAHRVRPIMGDRHSNRDQYGSRHHRHQDERSPARPPRSSVRSPIPATCHGASVEAHTARRVLRLGSTTRNCPQGR